MRTSSRGLTLEGRVLGERYRVLQLLAKGGVADVYLAERIGGSCGGARIALKVLRDDQASHPSLALRFEREAFAASRVRHPNVLSVGELERIDDLRLFSMELLVGLDLADTLAYRGVLAPERAVRIAGAVAAGAGAVHAAGVVHRDLKPENVFLVHAPDGREVPKVIDFGFAHVDGDRADAQVRRITERMTVVGTPEYMAPEQAHGAPAAPTADVYAIGVMLFEMLAGRVPFVGSSYPAIAHQHANALVPSMRSLQPGLTVSAELEALVVRALAKQPTARFPDGRALADALAAVPEGRRLRAGSS